jgi:pilus assembly protein CpaE
VVPKIQIIDHDVEAVEQLQAILEAEGYEVLTTVTGQAGLAVAELNGPNLILLELDLPDIDGYEILRALRGTPSVAQAPIMIYSSREDVASKVAGFKAGADDYIVKPAAAAELVARIRAALRSDEKALAHIVALWGSKGGVGTTTLASNLAVALRSKTGSKVTLMDAAVLGGMVEVLLNLPPSHTIADLVPRLYDLDAELLSSVLAKHSTGLRALLSAPASTDDDLIGAAQFERILAWLQSSTDYVVIDTSPSLDESTRAVLQLANQILLVITPEMTSLRNAKLFLNVAQSLQENGQETAVLLNRHPTKGGLALKDIEAALRTKVAFQVPTDEELVTYSVNRGVPLMLSHPRSAVAKAVARIAEAIVKAAKEGNRVAIMSTVLARRA